MKTFVAAAAPLCQAALFLMSFAGAGLSPLAAQEDSINRGDSANDRDRGHGSFHIDTVLYQGALVHDEQWVMTRGTTNNQLLGVFGGTCSVIPSNVSNTGGFELVRFEAEYQGLGVWKLTHTDTVVGTAVAQTGERYKYTYNLLSSATGITTNGKPPNPSRAMPTATSRGFLDPVPANIQSAALKLEDFFLLRDRPAGQLVADAHVVVRLHRAIDPSEQPPAFFPFILNGYIATDIQTIAGQAGCDPL
ncbi:MAG TPA: hypothetical protein VH601_23395 [Bryobacteraceae bacterium]|jgi:hypothetical protein